MNNQKEFLVIAKSRLIDLSEYFMRAIELKSVLLQDIGMLSIFLYQVHETTRSEKALQMSLDLRDIVLHRPVKDCDFKSVLFDPWINYYALKTWLQIDPTLQNRINAHYKPLEYFNKKLDSNLYELFTGLVGHSLLIDEDETTKFTLDSLRKKVVEIDGLKGLVAPRGFNGSDDMTANISRFNLGTPHGLVGVLLFAIRNNDYDLSNTLRSTLTEIWKSNNNNLPPFWPLAKVSTSSELSITHSPLAWCYGDPMLGYSQILFATKFPNSSSAVLAKQLGEEIWENVMNSKKDKLENLDFHFCHGKAGLAQIAFRTFQLNGDKRLKEWAQQLLIDIPLSPSEWLNEANKLNATKQSSFLSGQLGIAHVLLTLFGAKETKWDRLFLLS